MHEPASASKTTLERFHALWQAYRYREGLQLIPALISATGLEPVQLLSAANSLYSSGRFQEAALLSGKAWRMVPQDPRLSLVHAEILERCGDFNKAREAIEPLLAASVARAVRLEGHILRRENRLEEAATVLERQLRDHRSGDDWRLQYELAAVLDRMGRYPEAMAVLLQAKAALRNDAAPHRDQWRRMADFQWELTHSIQPAHLRRWREEPQLGNEPSVCLMAGFPRSGTTLVEKILGCHPGCTGTDESGILASQFRDDIVFGAASPSAALAEIDGFTGDELQAGRAEYFRATAEFTGQDLEGKWIVEKEPLLTADLPLPLRLFPGSRVLMPLRDPRDVLVSFFFTIVPLNWSSAAAISLEDSAKYYAETMRHWLHLRDMQDPSSWSECRYEELVKTPDAEIRRLCAFLDLQPVPEMFQHHQQPERLIARTPTYGDVREPVHSRSVGRWRHYAEWIEPHHGVLRPTMEAFGYAL
ncbi:MAG: Sulfotransferase protein [Akkermansiaceae bacterium]|nr:Sulfotransferase protein [Akkermansiaceae bacterium]